MEVEIMRGVRSLNDVLRNVSMGTKVLERYVWVCMRELIIAV